MAPTPYIDPYEVDERLRARPDGRTSDELDLEVLGQRVDAWIPPCSRGCRGDDHQPGCRYAAFVREQDYL